MYDTVLRRRGPGKKTKSKSVSGTGSVGESGGRGGGRSGNGKRGDGESTSPSAKSDGLPYGQDGGASALGSRFEMSTERS